MRKCTLKSTKVKFCNITQNIPLMFGAVTASTLVVKTHKLRVLRAYICVWSPPAHTHACTGDCITVQIKCNLTHARLRLSSQARVYSEYITRSRHAHSRARARSATVASKVSVTLRIGILYYTLCSLMLPY